jgi:hypothetical protein
MLHGRSETVKTRFELDKAGGFDRDVIPPPVVVPAH